MTKKVLATDKKVVTFGEVMLRLTTPNFRRFSQTNEFIATYGGSEANVAVSLAHFGIPAEFVTRLPDNAMAHACVAALRKSHRTRDISNCWFALKTRLLPEAPFRTGRSISPWDARWEDFFSDFIPIKSDIVKKNSGAMV